MSVLEKLDHITWILNQQVGANSAIAITAIATIAAVAAAIASYFLVRKAQSSIEASVFMSFSDRYNSEDMANSLRMLRDYYNKDKENFANNWNKQYEAEDGRALELNKARRNVSRYFMDVGRLYAGNLISRNLATLILSTESSDIYLKICEPMNDARHPSRPTKISRIVNSLLSGVSTTGIRAK